ncbi:hypothetical protein BpHYR1_012458, partial [Brachionus plicatilis]
NIRFEINRRPTEAHHVLQSVPATPRVARQLAEVERIHNLRLNANKNNNRKHNLNNN